MSREMGKRGLPILSRFIRMALIVSVIAILAITTLSMKSNSRTVTVYINAMPDGGTAPLPVYFTWNILLDGMPLPANTIVYGIWDLGDGTVTNGMPFTHWYNTSGNYTVKLKVNIPSYGITAETMTRIIVDNREQQIWVIEGFINVSGGTATNQSLTFALKDPDGKIVRCFVIHHANDYYNYISTELGDGGNYTLNVTLTYNDYYGHPQTLGPLTQNVTVPLPPNARYINFSFYIPNDPTSTPSPMPNAIPTPTPSTAPTPSATVNLTVTPKSGYAPLTVQFFASVDSGGTLPAPTGWAWNFGDNEEGDGQNVQHTYDTPGNYSIYLEVTFGDNYLGNYYFKNCISVLSPTSVPAGNSTPQPTPMASMAPVTSPTPTPTPLNPIMAILSLSGIAVVYIMRNKK